ncbi:MAG: GCN5-related N-acetyltransferase, FIGfam019367 [uncultured Nocardioidaceae bacterium]|uniref:GCN5-related N-acetyltransferase, FIGfam019367 n=1 Tax=uncultured Nocardioidaceae bacterium TaxID=253824 RepID=A0A6J4NVJ5_9ACTN|nr:MAG: GCN5-related N-acetyltransferase, FIGfam019367 [uncultured Nocardioidaceae bacterium]
MLGTQRELRVLGPADLDQVTGLLSRDPVVNVVTDYRARTTQLHPRWLNGEVLGYFEDDRLTSLCHSAANLIPVMAGRPALEMFAERAAGQGRRCSTLLGPSDQVEVMWDRLSTLWSPARSIRPDQPHLEITGPPLVDPDPFVMVSRPDEVDTLYPACVAMYTEEVGVSPEEHGGASLYRARVAQLVSRGWSFARIEEGRVVFKAEIAAASPHACQVQGVYVAPDRRGEGLGTAGMAAVVDLAMRHVAPVVSLYVNAHNEPARRVYERVGFRHTATFTTIMF